MIDKQQWLTTTFYFETVDIWTDEQRAITNQEILDRPAEERPVDWFDPFLLSEQEIDKMRQDFKGGCLKWTEYVKQFLPILNPKEERKKKKEADDLKAVAECGTKFKRKINKQGMLYYVPRTCNRYHLCSKCRMRHEQEHFERLMKLDGHQFVINRRTEMAATYGKDNVYSYKLPDGNEVTVIVTGEKIEGAQEMSYEIAKEHKSYQITGNKVSGKAGLEPKEEPEEEKESRTVNLVSPDYEASQEVEDQIETEYLEATKDFEPYSLDAAVNLLLTCQKIWFAIIRKHCEEIHFTERYNLKITQDDLDWSARADKIEKRLKWLKGMRR